MEKWQRPPAPPQQRRCRNSPSFSSSLLDSIYRSIDESDGRANERPLSNKQSFSRDHKWTPQPAFFFRLANDPAGDSRRRRLFSNSSSSGCSTFGGFSSSDADSTARAHHHPHPAPTRFDPTTPPSPPAKKIPGTTRSRIHDLRKSPGPRSPRARLAAFLNAIFSAAGGSPKATKIAGASSECSSASSSSVAVDEKWRLRGQKRIEPVVAAPTRDRRKMMEEESDWESESSSDLFELENLSPIVRFKDELPVYETTNMDTNIAIARGFIM